MPGDDDAGLIEEGLRPAETGDTGAVEKASSSYEEPTSSSRLTGDKPSRPINATRWLPGLSNETH
jgi:hypothetical protein